MDLTDVRWRKSRRSSNGGNTCVEIAPLPDRIAVRDSKDPDGPRLAFDHRTWAAFTTAAKLGGFDG